MNTWVSPGRQQHVTHYRQRLEKSLVSLLQSHHMKTNTALVRLRTALNELRSTNTDIWGRKPQRDRWTKHFCLWYSREKPPCTAHNTHHDCTYLIHAPQSRQSGRQAGREARWRDEKAYCTHPAAVSERGNTQRAADRPPPVQTSVAAASVTLAYWNPP